MTPESIHTSRLATQAQTTSGRPASRHRKFDCNAFTRSCKKQRANALLATSLLLFLVGGVTAGWGQQTCPSSPSYSPDFSSNGNCLALNSNAVLTGDGSTVLQLTNSSGNQVGSAWYLTPQAVQNGFSTTFNP